MEYRKTCKSLISGLVTDLQVDTANSGKDMSMWETLFYIEYTDFEVVEAEKQIFETLVTQFENGLQEQILKLSKGKQGAVHIPETEKQSSSEKWFNNRWPRVTASVCKKASQLGAKLITEDPDKRCLNKFINNMLWFTQSFVTPDMLYGVQEEPAVRVAYSKLTGYEVVETGLWVNSKYPHLGASPDGLVVDENSGAVAGIMEAKCLKILRNKMVKELIAECHKGSASDILKNQCFSLRCGKLCLKKCHSYYYQVQIQLLITEKNFCDFVLHTPKGPPAVERIWPEPQL